MGKRRRERKMEEAKGKVETILGNGTTVEGDLYTKGSLRIEGRVKGKIKAEGDLLVGESGNLETEIEVRNVLIAGTVRGNIKALNKIEILPSGKLYGDIKTKIIRIEEGAVFVGSSTPLEAKPLNTERTGFLRETAKETAAGKEKA